jgi:hypothetical protein
MTEQQYTIATLIEQQKNDDHQSAQMTDKETAICLSVSHVVDFHTVEGVLCDARS